MSSTYAYKHIGMRAAARLFDSVGALWPRRRAAWPDDPHLRIAVLRLDHLGDIICALPFLKALKKRVPRAHLTFITTPAGRILLRDVPEINDWFIFEPAWFARDSRYTAWPLKTMRDVAAILYRRTFDISIDLRGDLRHHVMMRWSKATYRAGYGQTGGGFLLDRQLSWNAQEHVIDKNLNFLELFPNAAPVQDEERIPVLPWKPKADEMAWFAAVIGNEPYRIYNVDAGTSAKRWPETHFSRLIAQMPSKQEKVILIGQDPTLTKSFRSSVRDPRIVDLVGKTSLGQMVMLLQKARAVISADSGPAHIASALGVPVLVLWSGTISPDIWRPLGARTLILQNPVPCQYCELTMCPITGHPCMDKLTVERVLPIWQSITTTHGA